MNYKLYRRKKRLKGKVKYSKNLPYTFNPAFRRHDDMIDISKLTIYDLKMINNVLTKKYIRKYKRLLKITYLLFNDQLPEDAGFPIVLGEVDKLRAILLDKYNKYLTLENIKRFLRELDYVESEVKRKYIEDKIFVQEILQSNFIR